DAADTRARDRHACALHALTSARQHRSHADAHTHDGTDACGAGRQYRATACPPAPRTFFLEAKRVAHYVGQGFSPADKLALIAPRYNAATCLRLPAAHPRRVDARPAP
ncbi:MAG TPA: hypothetical protein VE505_18235, partial [Vicinamibacterales bacterium]|nr:hypothetical protein [Vicinamibacterales bacterium]